MLLIDYLRANCKPDTGFFAQPFSVVMEATGLDWKGLWRELGELSEAEQVSYVTGGMLLSLVVKGVGK